jgi:hypothetical protein
VGSDGQGAYRRPQLLTSSHLVPDVNQGGLLGVPYAGDSGVFMTVVAACVAGPIKRDGAADEPVYRAPHDVDTVPKAAAV